MVWHCSAGVRVTEWSVAELSGVCAAGREFGGGGDHGGAGGGRDCGAAADGSSVGVCDSADAWICDTLDGDGQSARAGERGEFRRVRDGFGRWPRDGGGDAIAVSAATSAGVRGGD